MRQCSVEGCKNKHKAKGYCSKHWSQLDRRGKILEITRMDSNQIIEKEDYAVIVLRDTYGNQTGEAIIYKTTIPLIKKYKWYLNNSGYAITRVNTNKQMFLHRLLKKAPDDLYVDHIDGDPLNNRLNNLRLCTHHQNMMNLKTRIDNASGYKGVCWDKRKQKWRARIQVDKKERHLGYFNSLREAAMARKVAEEEYYGEYSRVN